MSTTGTWILGRLGKDPEFFEGKNGCACKTSVASSEYYDGEEKTEWHNIVCFGKTAEFLDKHFKQGDPIFVIGKNVTQSYENREGETRYTTSVVVDRICFVPSAPRNRSDNGHDDDRGYNRSRDNGRNDRSNRNDRNARRGQGRSSRNDPRSRQASRQHEPEMEAQGNGYDFEDDIPF